MQYRLQRLFCIWAFKVHVAVFKFITGQRTLVFDKTLKTLCGLCFFVRVCDTIVIEQFNHCQDDKNEQNQLYYASNSDKSGE